MNDHQIAALLQQGVQDLHRIATEVIIRDSWTSVLTAVGTLLAVAVALFLEPLRNYWQRPQLSIVFRNESPFCRTTSITTNFRTVTAAESYWIRLRILNKGRSVARKCKVKLVAIAHKDLKTIRQDVDPVVLHWVGSDEVRQAIEESQTIIHYSRREVLDINSEEYEYADLFCCEKGERDTLDIQAIDVAARGINFSPARDNYYVLLTAYAENAKPVTRIFKVACGKDFTETKLFGTSRREQHAFRRLITR